MLAVQDLREEIDKIKMALAILEEEIKKIKDALALVSCWVASSLGSHGELQHGPTSRVWGQGLRTGWSGQPWGFLCSRCAPTLAYHDVCALTQPSLAFPDEEAGGGH